MCMIVIVIVIVTKHYTISHMSNTQRDMGTLTNLTADSKLIVSSFFINKA